TGVTDSGYRIIGEQAKSALKQARCTKAFGSVGKNLCSASGTNQDRGRHTQVLLGNDLFRRERGYDFFEARITAQRIPYRIQTQVAIMHSVRDFGCYFELLNGQVGLVSPRI